MKKQTIALSINESNLNKFVECKDIIPYKDGVKHSVWAKNEIDRLVNIGKIPATRHLYCKKHCITYEAKPFCVINSLKQILYTNCPNCELDAIKTREKGYVTEAEKEALNKKRREEMILILLQSGIPPIFFNTHIDFKNGLFKKYHNKLSSKLDTNLIIVGDYGSGKSFFAYELVKLHYTMGMRVQIYSAPVLAGKYINMYKNLESIKMDFDNIELLVIDDLDILSQKDYPILDFLITLFYDNVKKIVFVGNINIDTFKEKLSPKSVSKLKNNCMCIST